MVFVPLNETHGQAWLGQEDECVHVADEEAAQDEVAQLAAGGADLHGNKHSFI